jgi:DNA invertase Pin-like site-specific DNA recombinase
MDGFIRERLENLQTVALYQSHALIIGESPAVVKKYKIILDFGKWKAYIYSMKKKKTDQRLIQLRKYMDKSGARIEDVARAIGVTGQTVRDWKDNDRAVSPLASKPLDDFLAGIDK